MDSTFVCMTIHPAPLTAQEKAVLKHLADGYSANDIALSLQLPLREVDTLRRSIMHKNNITSLIALGQLAAAYLTVGQSEGR